ncbi:MAG: hypothetical protein GXO36_00735, partial [Chloroflexi bacterium]|nr:hypothetical protein [Chloroflexota bacterium]
ELEPEASAWPWEEEAGAPEAEPESVPEAEAEFGAEAPAWPWEEEAGAPEAEPEAVPEAEAEFGAEAPAWPWEEEAGAPEAEPESVPEAEAELGADDDLSALLSELPLEREASDEEAWAPPERESDLFATDKLPEWFQTLEGPEGDEAAEAPADQTSEAPVSAPQPIGPEAEAPREDIPEWLQALKPEGADEVVPEPEGPVAAPLGEEPAPHETEPSGLVFDPDALFEEGPDVEEVGEPATLAVEGLSEEAVADVEARPRSAQAPWPQAGEEAARGETIIDALAGLPDLLPPDPALVPKQVRVRSPLTLRLTRGQTERAQWLRALLEEEEQPRQTDLPWEGADLPRGLLRFVAFALLLAMAIFLAPWLASMAPPAPAETVQAWQTIDALPPEAPVLVMTDVSWLNQAEMAVVAQPLLQHLAQKGSHVVVASTMPWGVQMAQDWAPATLRFWDAGFVPGGPIALAQFGHALPYALQLSGTGVAFDYVPAWRTVQAWDQVPLLVVLTDNPEALRLWFEQVVPHLPESTRLVLGISAQAVPVAYAYQPAVPTLGGMVVGFEGGLAYQHHLGTPVASTWSMYQAMLLAGTGWMLLMAFAYLGARWWSGRKKRREEKAATSAA